MLAVGEILYKNQNLSLSHLSVVSSTLFVPVLTWRRPESLPDLASLLVDL